MKLFGRFYIIVVLLCMCSQDIFSDDYFKLLSTFQPTTEKINKSFTKTEALSLPLVSPISGLSISGKINKQGSDYLVRVVMTDEKGKEYLVLESYEERAFGDELSFSDYCEETALLNNVQPIKLDIYLKDATFLLTDIKFCSITDESSDSLIVKKRMSSLRKSQTRTIIDRINAYNWENKRLWLAGETKISHLDYAQRKKIMGLSDESLNGGYEYYLDGIFELGHGEITQLSRSTNSSPYIDDFDWRDRHGINWMTPVKDQWWTEFCTGFATIACIEALTNLYFNQKIDVDLSEQELASCADSVPHYIYGQPTLDFDQICNYIITHGVCDEESFPFQHVHAPVPCISDSINPNELIKIAGTQDAGAFCDDIKHDLIKYGPLKFGLYTNSSMGHAMALVGYHTLKAGDVVYTTVNYLGNTIQCTIPENDPRIGSVYWVFKDSYGPNSHYPHNGYSYILFKYTVPMLLGSPKRFLTPITSLNYSEDDIVWEDRDGDGFFNWGIGPKPSSCPSWVPYVQDGNDADPQIGEMDSYGNCLSLCENISDTLFIVHDSDNQGHNMLENVKVISGATLSITGDIIGHGNYSITVDHGSTLIVDGASYRYAEINLAPHANLIVKNGGKIYLRNGKDLFVPLGANLSIENGEIINSSY